jgi:type I restriction-modification system DNA methylase subunit
MNDPRKSIIKLLEKCADGGYYSYQVFDDWLDLVLACLHALPGHLKAQAKGEIYQDTDETAQLFEKLRGKYKRPEYFDWFSQAFAELLNSTDTYQDVVGDVYMEMNISNKRVGQYFTPYPVAKAMAEMSLLDIEKQLYDRVKQAVLDDPFGQAVTLAGIALPENSKELESYFFTHILPSVADKVDPIKIADPCCGSGIMLIASASCIPRWAIEFNLVQFFGMDLDLTCVKMAQVNMMLYGLNGFWIQCALSLPEETIKTVPEPYQSAYTEAKTAQQSGDLERVEKIKTAIRNGEYIQTPLFEYAEV